MVSLQESLRITSRYREEHGVCSQCGEKYVGLDTNVSGDVFIIHQESPMKSCKDEEFEADDKTDKNQLPEDR